MNKNQFKKYFWYEIDPLFFFDSNNDGFGDFDGFIKKIEYFKYLNIDGIIFPDIFNQEDKILKNINQTIYDKYGNLNELKTLIETLKENKIEFCVQITIDKILNSMILRNDNNSYIKNDVSRFFENDQNEKNNNVLYWNNEKRKNAFKKILNFWIKLGVKSIVFTDFEHIYEKSSYLDIKLVEQLKYFYKQTKEISKDVNVGIRTLFFNNKTINSIFKQFIGSMCDFVIDSSYSLIGTDKHYPFDIMKKFNHKKILKKISGLNIDSNLNSRYFISFNTNSIGRVSSRWLNEKNLIDEASKTLIMLQNLLPYSSINFYGDEIGVQRIKINSRIDYQDYEYVGKKRELESKKFKINFETSQKFLSRIHSQSTFIWNKKIHCGFSQAKKINRNLPINFKTHNALVQYNNENSILNFYRKIIDISKNSNLTNVINNKKIHIKSSKKLLSIHFQSNSSKKWILINLSNRSINKKIGKKWMVVTSTFPQKKYEKNISVLIPYESIILEKKFNQSS